MKLDAGIHIKQEQKLIMTQELQTAVKILQFTTYELLEYIDEQLVENPLLEVDEKSNDKNDENWDLNKFVSNIQDKEYYSDYHEEEDTSALAFGYEVESLWSFLKHQLNVIPINKTTRQIGEYIIDNIDDNGYLKINIEDITKRWSVTSQEAEEIIELIQGFEPPGICARNLEECLVIQLKHLGLYDEIFNKIINQMIELVAMGKVSDIAKANNLTLEEAKNYMNHIKSLDPKPGIRYSNETTKYIIPDVIVEKSDEKYIVTINDEFVPKIKVNDVYRKIINDKNSKDFNYVKERVQAAIWLIKSIEQRRNTIKMVVEEIINHQLDFFDNDKDLKPLNLKQIADKLNISESTVSRAIKGKYMQTPKGVFEIKNFLLKGIQSDSGEEVGILKIKNRIREVIAGEDKKRPYSDQVITEILNNEGINISRRTVAKYREEMNIFTSSKRKE